MLVLQNVLGTFLFYLNFCDVVMLTFYLLFSLHTQLDNGKEGYQDGRGGGNKSQVGGGGSYGGDCIMWQAVVIL